MNKSILNTDIQEFILNNLNSNTAKLLLKGSPFKSIDFKDVITQIDSKKKCEKKLPTWFHAKNIYYPKTIHIEQSSSELTADYKSKLLVGKSLIDISAGLGVDSYYFSKVFQKVIHCEINLELSAIAAYNFSKLGASNISCLAEDGIDFLTHSESRFDCIYIDPSRRSEDNKRVHDIKECNPNIIKYEKLLLNKADKLLVKLSPMLDITATIAALKYVKNVYVIAVKNELKELLFEVEKNHKSTITIKTVNLLSSGPVTFNFTKKEEELAEIKYSNALTYLYEPNTALLKAGCFKLLAKKYSLSKLALNTHLYTSNELHDFPGQVYKINRKYEYQKKQLKSIFYKTKFNLKLRNFPLRAKELRQKLKFKDGGDKYVFFTSTINNENIVLECSKMNVSS